MSTKFIKQFLSNHLHELMGFSYALSGDMSQCEDTVTDSILAYTVEKKSGPDHEPEFKVTASINSQNYSNGVGSSIQKAEEKAAKNLLKKLESKN